MDCQLILRTANGVRRWILDDWLSLTALACLSAEPETDEEFAASLRRYLARPDWASAGESLDTIPFEELEADRAVDGRGQGRERQSGEGDGGGEVQPWCLIDLVGRTILAGGGYELPERRGTYGVNEESEPANDPFREFPPLGINDLLSAGPASAPGAPPCDHSAGDGPSRATDSELIWMNLPDNWVMDPAGEHWVSLVEQRATARRSAPPLDARAVLFGPALYEYIAQGILGNAEAVTDLRRADAEDDELDLIRRLHAGWMMTERADLGVRAPRDVLLADHEYVQEEIEKRSRQWSHQGFAPPPLPKNSAAYRCGGFGVAEIVTYFDLVRHVFSEACRMMRIQPSIRVETLVAQLQQSAEEWLDTPLPDEPSLTSRMIIETTRQRLPVCSDPETLDDDCPICRAEKDGLFGPSFLMFSGYHMEMEDDFAFSLYDRDDWESMQASYRPIARGAGTPPELPDDSDSAGDADSPPDSDGSDSTDATGESLGSVWRSTYTSPSAPAAHEVSPALARMMLSFPLAEIVDYLQQQPGGRPHLEEINRAFDSFRRATDPAVMASHAVALREQLESTALAFPDLTSRGADFQSKLDELLRAARNGGESGLR